MEKILFYQILEIHILKPKLYINNSNFREHVFDRYKEFNKYFKNTIKK